MIAEELASGVSPFEAVELLQIAPPISTSMAKIPSDRLPTCTAYVLEITLAEIKPPIRRVVLVSNSITLATLHRIIQAAMGWSDSHLHRFEKGDENFGIPDDEFDCTDERTTRLSSVLRRVKDSMVYEYDFGDSWIHKIKLLDIFPNKLRSMVPEIIVGERNCPPEDIGGTDGYEELLEMIKSGEAETEGHPKASFRAEEFNLEKANLRLKQLAKRETEI